jgi:hypothetical protein
MGMFGVVFTVNAFPVREDAVMDFKFGIKLSANVVVAFKMYSAH